MARKNVVIVKDTKGNTCYVAFPKMLEEHEINKAVNECLKYEQRQEKEKHDLYDRVNHLEYNCYKLELDIKLDRGELTKEQYDKEIMEYGK